MSARADARRAQVELQATYQFHAMLDMLRCVDGEEGHEFMIRASLPRLKALTSAVMSVLGDDGRGIEEMGEVVHG